MALVSIADGFWLLDRERPLPGGYSGPRGRIDFDLERGGIRAAAGRLPADRLRARPWRRG